MLRAFILRSECLGASLCKHGAREPSHISLINKKVKVKFGGTRPKIKLSNKEKIKVKNMQIKEKIKKYLKTVNETKGNLNHRRKKINNGTEGGCRRIRT